MKVTFKRNVDCDYFDRRMDETYPRYFRKWESLSATDVEEAGAYTNLALDNGDTVLNVPRGAVEVTK